jgi:hypothetical protein
MEGRGRARHPPWPEHPGRPRKVTLDLSLNEGTVDIVSGNFDAGIRLDESVEKDLIAIRLTPEITWSIVGSPDYFAHAGRPQTPEDLTEHEAILYRFVTSGLPHRREFSQGDRVVREECRVQTGTGRSASRRGLRNRRHKMLSQRIRRRKL